MKSQPPPPLPPEQPKSTTWLEQLTGNVKAAGQLVAKQTERTKLANSSLPAAYRELGRDVHANGRFQEDFPDLLQKLAEIILQVQTIDDHSGSPTPTNTTSGKMKAIADSTKNAANKKLLQQKRGQALAALGKAAYERHGQQAGGAKFVTQVSECLSRIEMLDAEIADLSEVGKGRLVTPKRVLIAGGALLLVLLFLAYRLAFPGTYQAATLWAMSETQADALEGKWITVVGEVTNARYFPDGAPMMFLQENKSMIVMKNDSGGEVSFEFDGPDSGGIQIDSLSRGDRITVKGKVYLGTEKVVGLRLCEILSGP